MANPSVCLCRVRSASIQRVGNALGEKPTRSRVVSPEFSPVFGRSRYKAGKLLKASFEWMGREYGSFPGGLSNSTAPLETRDLPSIQVTVFIQLSDNSE